MTKMAVYQPRRAAIATILVTVMQDDICEELLGRHKRKKCSTNMAGPRIAYQTTTPLLVAWFFRFFRFSHFLAFSVTVVRIFVQIIALFFTGRWQSGSHIALCSPWLAPLTEKLSHTIIRAVKRKKNYHELSCRI